jgi:hypothetical protein
MVERNGLHMPAVTTERPLQQLSHEPQPPSAGKEVFSPKCASKSWRRHLLVLRNSRRASTDSCEFFDCTSTHHKPTIHISELARPLDS